MADEKTYEQALDAVEAVLRQHHSNGARPGERGLPGDGWRELATEALHAAGLDPSPEDQVRAGRWLWQAVMDGANSYRNDAARVLAAVGYGSAAALPEVPHG